MKQDKKLDSIRQRIDDLDAQIQDLISARGALAKEVADEKLKTNEGPVFYRPEREAQVLRRVIERNNGPLADEEIARLFREIMSACLALEHPMTIAYFGQEGTFTQAAALKHFGHSVKTSALGAIDEVFREVQSGNANYGIVPVENSTEGVINHTLDMFLNSPLKISGEVALRVHQNLLGKMTDLSEIKKLYSHEQSLAQCRKWLDKHLIGVERVAVDNNAEAARRAAAEDGVAAIAGGIAAEIYNLDVLCTNIEDEPDNTTRFLIIGRGDTPPSGIDKTSILVSSKNQPGALARLLKPFADSQISMTRIESRPSRLSMWDYVFFIDIKGHQQDPRVSNALAQLEQEAAMFKILGSYPEAVL